MAEPSFKDLAYRALAGTIGGPVDIATMFMRPFGYNVPPEQVFGSSEYLGKKMEQGGLVSEARDPTQEFLASMAVPTPSVPLKAAGMLPEVLAGLMGVTAYHGSPYLFKQFNPARIGTGEGAQQYGAGAGYTAESRPIAESFKMSSSAERGFQFGDNKDLTREDVYSLVKEKFGNQTLDGTLATPAGVADRIMETLASGGDVTNLPKHFDPDSDRAKIYKELSKQLSKPSKGYLYKGDIPDEILPAFLNWNEPLKNQEIFDKLKNNPDLLSYAKQKKIDVGEMQGRDVYEVIASGFDVNQKEAYPLATEYLNNLGVRGIRYLDQGSLGDIDGTSNFVVFRPEDYQIQEINDLPIEEYIRKGLLE